MKKIYKILTVILFAFISVATHGQVVVTNPANVGPSPLAATYTSLDAAVTDLNTKTSITGPVIITLNALNNQTTPAGGYAITAILAGASATNTVVFEGSANTITAFTPQVAGNLNDAIFKIIGADFITIQNFVMQENPANIVNTPGGSNTMTEWGVALLRASTTDGVQNNTIQNNTISLNRIYRNTFGVYSNSIHTTTNIGAFVDITNGTTAPHSGNKIYGNTISNVNVGITFIGSRTAAFQDIGNDIGGTGISTGNTISNWGGNSALSSYVSNSGTVYGILMNHQTADNISFNTLTSAAVSGVTISVNGIRKDYTTTAPIGTITSSINNNTITLSSANTSGAMNGILSLGAALSTLTINITDNSILNSVINGVGTTSTFNGITNSSACGTLNITGNIIRGTTSTAATTGGFFGISNSGAVVNTINITNNQVGNTAGGAISFSAAITGGITGIQNTAAAATTTVNLNNNSVEGISAVSSGQLAGIINTGLAGIAVNINNNNLGSASANFVTYSAPTSNTFFGLLNSGGVVATTVTSISNNNIRGVVHSVTASSIHQYINSNFAGATQNINNNTFTNLNVNTTGDVIFIAKLGDMTATGVENCSNNSIVTAFNKTGAGGTVYFYFSGASAVNGSTMTQNGNNFSNVTVTGPAAIGGWFNADGAFATNAPTKTITGNTFTNINGGSGLTYVMAVDYAGLNSSVTSNTISTISGGGDVVGIIYDLNCNQGTHNIKLNNITNLSSTGVGGGEVYGILAGSVNIPTLNVDSNTVTGLSTAGPSSSILGIGITDGTIANVNTNIINTLIGSGTTNPLAAGIAVLGGNTVNVGYNKIHTINQIGINAATGPVVLGISLNGGLNVTTHNNFVANLNAANTPNTDAIRGISVTSTTPLSTYNLFYNSVHVNSPSNLATSGTSGIYHTTSSTATTGALNMIDNIIVNTSAPAGAGVTAAYRRSDATLANFASTSNYNLLYGGVPAANQLIFYDGTNSDLTLAAYQARVAAREANSISSFPNFTSATDLHLIPATNCPLDNKGTPIVGYTNDIDNNTRSTTIPDIGADEFDAVNSGVLAGAASTTVCSSKDVVNTGTSFTDGSCNLIARVLPSGGGTAVTGTINTCVYLDPTVLPVYNAEPYLQRHFDIIPSTLPLTSTATITLYFLQSEFNVYNANNGLWPDLPTGPGDVAGIANLRITQYHGNATPPGGWPANASLPNQYSAGTRTYINNAVTVWNTVNGYWEVTFNVIGFSGFYIHTNLQYALPISLNYLKGTKQGTNHLLNWKVTCNTSPRVTLVLERSASTNSGFTAINSIDATAARCATPFNYTDASPLQGMNYYRLKMIDADGKVTYSNVIAILNAAKGFEVINIAPNPVTSNGTFKLNITSAKAEKLQTIITDMQGRIVATETITTAAGYNSIDMNVAKLAAGTYSLYTTNNGEKSKVIRFVKQ